MIPVVESPDKFNVIVVGGEGGVSLLVLDIGAPATAKIRT